MLRPVLEPCLRPAWGVLSLGFERAVWRTAVVGGGEQRREVRVTQQREAELEGARQELVRVRVRVKVRVRVSERQSSKAHATSWLGLGLGLR